MQKCLRRGVASGGVTHHIFTTKCSQQHVIRHAIPLSRMAAGYPTLQQQSGGFVVCHLHVNGVCVGRSQCRNEHRTLCYPLQALKAMLGPNTKLVATVHVSNMLGSVTDIADLADAVHTVCIYRLSVLMDQTYQR